MLDDFGSLSVRAYSADGALPVPGAVVKIIGAEEENRFVAYSLLTDSDGVTPPVELPTRKRSLSLSPTPEDTPYAIYDITVSAGGYIDKTISAVPIFSGIYSLQPVNMIPHTAGKENIPRGSRRATVSENEPI